MSDFLTKWLVTYPQASGRLGLAPWLSRVCTTLAIQETSYRIQLQVWPSWRCDKPVGMWRKNGQRFYYAIWSRSNPKLQGEHLKLKKNKIVNCNTGFFLVDSVVEFVVSYFFFLGHSRFSFLFFLNLTFFLVESLFSFFFLKIFLL